MRDRHVPSCLWTGDTQPLSSGCASSLKHPQPPAGAHSTHVSGALSAGETRGRRNLRRAGKPPQRTSAAPVASAAAAASAPRPGCAAPAPCRLGRKARRVRPGGAVRALLPAPAHTVPLCWSLGDSPLLCFAFFSEHSDLVALSGCDRLEWQHHQHLLCRSLRPPF